MTHFYAGYQMQWTIGRIGFFPGTNTSKTMPQCLSFGLDWFIALFSWLHSCLCLPLTDSFLISFLLSNKYYSSDSLFSLFSLCQKVFFFLTHAILLSVAMSLLVSCKFFFIPLSVLQCLLSLFVYLEVSLALLN